MTRLFLFSISFLLLPFAGVASGSLQFRGGLDHELLDLSAYPLAPAAFLDDKLYSVVDGTGGRAVIDRDGQDTLLPEDSVVHLVKGEAFADGVVEVLASRVEPTRSKPRLLALGGAYQRSRGSIAGTRVSVEFRPSADFQEATLGILFFNDFGQRALHIQGLGDLQAGVVLNEEFELPFAYDDRREAIRYALLFFSSQGEIVTGGREPMTPFLNRMFDDFYSDLVMSYQASRPSETVPVSLAHRFPVEVDDSLIRSASGDTLYFMLEIDELGKVAKIVPEDNLEESLLKACSASLQEWLFLPRLEDGFLVRSQVRVPLRFR